LQPAPWNRPSSVARGIASAKHCVPIPRFRRWIKEVTTNHLRTIFTPRFKIQKDKSSKDKERHLKPPKTPQATKDTSRHQRHLKTPKTRQTTKILENVKDTEKHTKTPKSLKMRKTHQTLKDNKRILKCYL
jgi:hypothetical protein